MSGIEISDGREAQFAELSGAAFGSAYERTLESGGSALVTDHGALYRVFSGGQRVFVKSIPSPTRVTVGKVIHAR